MFGTDRVSSPLIWQLSASDVFDEVFCFYLLLCLQQIVLSLFFFFLPTLCGFYISFIRVQAFIIFLVLTCKFFLKAVFLIPNSFFPEQQGLYSV